MSGAVPALASRVDARLPVRVGPQSAGTRLTELSNTQRADIESALLDVGGVLLRGFSVPSVGDFRDFAASFGHALLNYEFASTPRSAVSGGVYTSTEYPAHQKIPLHSEQSYTREWPMKIWFHCVTASRVGGETPIADNRQVYERIPPRIRERFAAGVVYVRNFGDVDVSWQKTFNTDNPADVEAFCRRAHIEFEWLPGARLRTRQWCQAIETHPVTGQKIWFNQAHLFHASSLKPNVRAMLEELVGADNLPRDTRYADGTPIPDAVLDEVRSVLDEQAVLFPWQQGDVLMLDNMICSHGRSTFEGARRVVVAMAESHGNLDRARSEA